MGGSFRQHRPNLVRAGTTMTLFMQLGSESNQFRLRGDRDRPERPSTFSVIMPEQIIEWSKRLEEEHGFNLSEVPIIITRPGEDKFDYHELTDKLRAEFPDEAIEQKIKELGYDEVSLEALRKVAAQEHVVLDGRLRGFALTTDKDEGKGAAGEKEILFFAIRDDEAIAKAEQYAAKHGDAGKAFASKEEAKKYLKGLSEWVFHHEVGHVTYAATQTTDRKLWDDWNTYTAGHKELQEAVRRVQDDKWTHGAPPGHVEDEAFAETFVDVISRGRLRNRLGEFDEAVQRVRKILGSAGVQNI